MHYCFAFVKSCQHYSLWHEICFYLIYWDFFFNVIFIANDYLKTRNKFFLIKNDIECCRKKIDDWECLRNHLTSRYKWVFLSEWIFRDKWVVSSEWIFRNKWVILSEWIFRNKWIFLSSKIDRDERSSKLHNKFRSMIIKFIANDVIYDWAFRLNHFCHSF
jgi:hypothetical protein